MNERNTRRGFTQSRHAEFISASSRYDNNQILNQFNQTPYYNLTGRGPVVKAAVQDDNIDQTALGFTLIELLVVVLIIGILAAVAVPQYQKAVFKTRLVATLTACETLFKSAELYRLANGTWPTELDEFDIEMPGSLNNTKNALNGDNFICEYISSTPSIMCYLKQGNNAQGLGIRRFFKGKCYCFAKKDHDFYNQVCKNFSGTNINTSLSGDYNYYKIK